MAQSRSETLELYRADCGQDLWAAVEAAQYARLVEHDAPRTDVEAAQMQDLIGFFSDCSEQWERKSISDQAVALERLGNRVTALEGLELFVYWAVIEGRFNTPEGELVDLPLAVLTIARDRQPSITVNLPGAMNTG